MVTNHAVAYFLLLSHYKFLLHLDARKELDSASWQPDHEVDLSNEPEADSSFSIAVLHWES